MKWLVLLVLLGLAAYLFRRRLGRALKLAAALYLVFMVVRLAQWPDGGERLLDLLPALALFGVAWLLVRLLVSLREAKSAKAAGRRQGLNGKQGAGSQPSRGAGFRRSMTRWRRD